MRLYCRRRISIVGIVLLLFASACADNTDDYSKLVDNPNQKKDRLIYRKIGLKEFNITI